MDFSQERKGELFIISGEVLWSMFPIVAILTYTSLTPLSSLAFGTFFSTLFFALLVTYQKKWHEIKKKHIWKDIFWTALIIGVLYHGLVFVGIQYTTAGNTSIFLLMEIFFSFVLLGIFKKEKIVLKNVLGAVFMVSGAFVLLFPKSSGFNRGDILIIGATIFPPLANYLQQKIRREISTGMLLFLRSLITSIFLFILTFLFSQLPTGKQFQDSFLFLLASGFLFFGISKIFWIEGIHRIPITKAVSLTTIVPFCTLIFAYFMLGEIPTLWQVASMIPMIIGIMFILQRSR